MTGRAWWVLSPADGTAHLLAVEGPGFITTQCRRWLPSGILRYDRLPSRHLCRGCVAAYLLPLIPCSRARLRLATG